MIHPTRFPSWRLAAAALLLASGATTAQAQDVQGAPVQAAASAEASPFELSGRGDLERATTYILERIAEHRKRLERMDNTVSFFRQSGDTEKVRLVDHLRERELNAFHQTLEEYRRLLGNKDFDRVIAAVRERMSAGDLPQGRVDGGTDATNGGSNGNPRNDSRRLAVERARATQRAKNAARMKEATSSELRRRAQAARSVTSALPSSSSSRAGARGVSPVLPGASGTNGSRNGQPYNPYTRQRGRP